LSFYQALLILPDEEQPRDDVFNDDVEIEKWWTHKNNPGVSNMRTSTKNRRAGKSEVFSF
jgi:hypothetical protein